MCVPWELNPQPLALLTQCSTTEPQEHYYMYWLLTQWDVCSELLLLLYLHLPLFRSLFSTPMPTPPAPWNISWPCLQWHTNTMALEDRNWKHEIQHWISCEFFKGKWIQKWKLYHNFMLFQTVLGPTDFHSKDKNTMEVKGNPETIWLLIFFKISYLVFQRRKKGIQVWSGFFGWTIFKNIPV